MPLETRDYMPKLQAVKNIIANPGKYGITLPKIENQPFFVTIAKTRDMDVKVAADLAELPVDDFRALNPQFGYHVITGGTQTTILLPQQNADKFKTNLEKSNNANKALSSWTTYKVSKSREKVEEIASRFNTTPETLRAVNNIPEKMLLKSGSTILVPQSEKIPHKDIAPEVAENATISTVYDGPPSKHIKVKVRKRDTLTSLAKRYRVTPAQVKAWNRLESDKLVAGTKLEIYVPYKIAKKRNTKKNVATQQSHKKSG
jgi:membrane-bound lytic murein transglycosylase D